MLPTRPSETMNEQEQPAEETPEVSVETQDTTETTVTLDDLANDPTFAEVFQHPAVQAELSKAQDYTRKTQDLADQRRDIEAIKTKAEQYEELQTILANPQTRSEFISTIAGIGGEPETQALPGGVTIDDLTDSERSLYELYKRAEDRASKSEKALEEVLPVVREIQDTKRISAATAEAKARYGIDIPAADLVEAMKQLKSTDPLHAAAHIAATRPNTPPKPTTVSAQGQRASEMEEMAGSAGFSQVWQQGANKATGR